MAGSRRRREQKQRAKQRLAEAALHSVDLDPTFERSNGSIDDVVRTIFERLPPDLHAEIHRRLDFLRRLAFASICGASSGHMLTPEAPCLIFPGETVEQATILSLADGASTTATVRASPPAMRGHVVIGSSGGWLVTADAKGALRMANPATGAHADLPAITTIPFLSSHGSDSWFCLHVEPFVQMRFGGPPPPEDKDWGPRPPRTSTLTAAQMRQKFYRKVVLSASPRPGSYAAMLITDRHIGSPAFATAADPSWRMAPSRDGVEDAIHHGGRFYSITYSGVVEAWRRNRDTGEFTSTVVAPRLEYSDEHLRRKYLAAAPDGRLMAVLKHSRNVELQGYGYGRHKATRVFFRVRVLDQEQRRWEAADDIGDAALFVGVNASVCVPAAEHGGGGIKPGCVYYTDDEVGEACMRHEQGRTNNDGRLAYGETKETELRETGMYSFKTGNVVSVHAAPQQNQQQNNHEDDENDELYVYPVPAEVEEEPRQHYGSWPPAAWFTPSFL